MGKHVKWTDEMKHTLIRLYQDGLPLVEISERLGVPYEAVNSALRCARKGTWGAEYKIEPRTNSRLTQTNSEALAQGMTYGQLQAKKMCEAQKRAAPLMPAPEPSVEVVESGPEPQELTVMPTDTPIDMVGAVDVLTACAQMFGCDKLLEIRGSATLDRAGITFSRGDRVYILSVRNIDNEE
ncbi:MAG: sigma-70 family RNA polymerase sigma factor [Alistipes sp.]|nr:sigma-70 family RNA polymerase sigma factor [Alistipes sp.]